MTKLLLLLLSVGIIYILYKRLNCESNSNSEIINKEGFNATSKVTINVSASKIEENDKIQYLEFTTNTKQPNNYIMINYKELSDNKKKDILQTIKDIGLNSLLDYLCPADTEYNIDNCINYALKIKTIPIFLINTNNRNYSDGNILSVKSVYNKKKDGTIYNSLIPYNTPKVDFDNKKILDFSINKVTYKDIDNASLYFDDNNIEYIGTYNKNKINKPNMFQIDFSNVIELAVTAISGF